MAQLTTLTHTLLLHHSACRLSTLHTCAPFLLFCCNCHSLEVGSAQCITNLINVKRSNSREMKRVNISSVLRFKLSITITQKWEQLYNSVVSSQTSNCLPSIIITTLHSSTDLGAPLQCSNLRQVTRVTRTCGWRQELHSIR